jgi:hypothetical protein
MIFCKECSSILVISKTDIKFEHNLITEPQQFLEIIDEDFDSLNNLIKFSENDLKKHLENIKKIGKEKEAIMDKYLSIIKSQGNKAEFCYECKNCKSRFELSANTIIQSINYDIDKNINIYIPPEIRCADPTLPRTKNYICPNQNCKSHKDLINKEAIWYRTDHNGVNYYIEYVCCMCKKAWTPT